jgi:ParB-like chromosome segregation protein Spo0J
MSATQASTSLAIEVWNIDRPIPYIGNPRKTPPGAIEKVATSIKEFGWRQPIVVDKKGVVIAGHTRLLAAQSLGLATVPVHVARNLTAAQADAYRLMDNRSSEETEWNPELLGPQLAKLEKSSYDLALTGFSEAELNAYLRQAALNQAPPKEVTRAPNGQFSGAVELKELLARWMIANSFATGHGDTLEDLVFSLIAQGKPLEQ